jgi:ABC-2 type transport system permease protein
VADALVDFTRIARLWVRASMAYPASFWMLAVGSFVMTGLDFAAILVIFGRVDSLGGFTLHQVAFLYAGTGVGIAFGDFAVGRVERLGSMIRLGRLDTMMTKPVPLLVQVLADEFALRRLARILQAGLVFAWAATFVDWSPARVAVAGSMVVCGSLIFSGLFVSLATIQFWTIDSAEMANAFTYGGNSLTQYPLSIYPSELVKVLTFAVPIAFVNWYPSLYVLGVPDPFGLPSWLQYAAPVAAVVVLAATALVWRTGVRHYRSTGS